MAAKRTRRQRNGRLREWPRITPGKTPTGALFWTVDTGKRVTPRHRKRYDSEDEALQVASRLREKYATEGLDGFAITAAEREDASAALKVLRATGVSLLQAAEFYRAHCLPAGGDKTVAAVVGELVEFKQRMGKRDKTLGDYRTRLGIFAKTFGKRNVKDLTAAELETWLFADPSKKAATKLGYHRVLNLFFNYARGRRDRKTFTAQPYRMDNPMDKVARPPKPHQYPERCLTLPESTALLRAARSTQKEFGLLPYVALGLFCGIRPNELDRMTWAHVDLFRGQVHIPAGVAKTKDVRFIPIPDNARLWLAMTGEHDKAEKIVPQGFNKRWNKVRDDAGLLKGWPFDGLRHAFGSYCSDLHGPAETRERMGHGSEEMLFRHYRTLVHPGEGEKFFDLVPEGVEALKAEAAG